VKTIRKHEKTAMKSTVLILIVVSLSLVFISNVAAQQTGATVVNSSTTKKATVTPGNLTNDKGTITTVELSSDQQDTKWKAYVGNVSANFVLDDSEDYSIYQWSVTSFTGQVYITRDSGVSWTNIMCATIFNKTSEDTMIGHTSTAADSVNSTFPTGAHKAFSVGERAFGANACYSAATWVNDTAQTPSATALFQELLLWDNSSDQMVYTTFVESDAPGYRNDIALHNVTYDFQAIVPDNATTGSSALRYFFYLELTAS